MIAPQHGLKVFPQVDHYRVRHTDRPGCIKGFYHDLLGSWYAPGDVLGSPQAMCECQGRMVTDLPDVGEWQRGGDRQDGCVE
jgi:hypothetical protein